MRRYLLAGLLLIVCALAGFAAALGLTPVFLINAPSVGASIGAKLLCSAEYVMGQSRDQAFDDLVQYSPILSQLTITYDQQARAVDTSLFGLSATRASYLPGLGCAVEYTASDPREAIVVATPELQQGMWPGGDTVPVPAADVQDVLDAIVVRDNATGLNTRAMLVVQHGELIAESYAQQTETTTPLLGWSMSKSLMAIMLGNLEMRGLIDLSATPDIAQWTDDGRADISIEHLLTMTDGLEFSEEYSPGDDVTAMLFTSASMADYALSRPLANPPGEVFSYSSGTANILSSIYTQTLGSPQAAYDNFITHIAEPLGFRNAVFEVDASGMFAGSSYFYAAARDWARMGQLMLNEGRINGEQVVTPDWVRRATTPNASQNERSYGYQWWLNSGDARLRLPDLPASTFYANGNRHQYVVVVPEFDAVIVRLGWTQGGYPANRNFAEILAALDSN